MSRFAENLLMRHRTGGGTSKMWRWRGWRRGWGLRPPITSTDSEFPLLYAPTGSRVTVMHILGPPMVFERITAMGIIRGSELLVVKNNYLDHGLGPIIIRTSDVELAVGRGMASYIIVKMEQDRRGPSGNER